LDRQEITFTTNRNHKQMAINLTKNDLNASLCHLGEPETAKIKPEFSIHKRYAGFISDKLKSLG